MNINLHIERLVLEGLPVEARHAALVREAIEAELTRLLAENGLSSGLQTGGVFPRLHADAVHLDKGNLSPQIGRQIGQAVYGSIGNGRTER
ncbi:MAG TPA: hypothetical protein VJZ91_06855 [Blastocatellia bacterium]|nr:hypothetical protein [Blastocatellia bacterium]